MKLMDNLFFLLVLLFTPARRVVEGVVLRELGNKRQQQKQMVRVQTYHTPVISWDFKESWNVNLNKKRPPWECIDSVPPHPTPPVQLANVASTHSLLFKDGRSCWCWLAPAAAPFTQTQTRPLQSQKHWEPPHPHPTVTPQLARAVSSGWEFKGPYQ